MAEGGEDGNWWGGWMRAAKDKSTEAWGFMKRDLAEFTSVVQKDTSAVVAHTADSVKTKLKVEESPSSASSLRAGFSNFLAGLSETLAPKNYGSDEEDNIPHKVIFDRAKARLHDIQTDPGTYLNDPSGPIEDYLAWKDTYIVDEHKGDISDLLVASDEVRSIYTKLVPSAASHADFWHRYFYRIHQLEQDEARRAALKERAEISKTFTEEDLGWGDDDETWEVTDAPEDMPTDMLQPDPSQPSTDKQEPDTQMTKKDCETNPDDQTETLTSTDLDKDKETRTKITDDDNASKDISQDSSEMTKEVIPESTEHMDKTETVKDDSEHGKDSCDVASEGSIGELKFDDRKTLNLPLTKDDLRKDGSGKSSPVHSDNGTGTKDTSSLSDDWERDFDIEITEQDLKHAASLTASGKEQDKEDDLEDDWENWE